MNKNISFAFGLSADEAAAWKNNIEMVARLPQPASGTVRVVSVADDRFHVGYYKDGNPMMTYTAERHYIAGWVASYSGKADDFGYGDVGTMALPNSKLNDLRYAIACEAKAVQ